MALELCNFQHYCIVLQWVKESSRRGDVTAKAAAEWWTGAGTVYSCCSRLVYIDGQSVSHRLIGQSVRQLSAASSLTHPWFWSDKDSFFHGWRYKVGRRDRSLLDARVTSLSPCLRFQWSPWTNSFQPVIIPRRGTWLKQIKPNFGYEQLILKAYKMWMPVKYFTCVLARVALVCLSFFNELGQLFIFTLGSEWQLLPWFLFTNDYNTWLYYALVSHVLYAVCKLFPFHKHRGRRL